MKTFDQRLEAVLQLRRSLEKNRDAMVQAAVSDLQFTWKDSNKEVDVALDRLLLFERADFLRRRVPLQSDARVALMLSYNGSAWLNTTIASIFLVGNRVVVKFSSKGRRIRALTESMYRPIFGDAVSFYEGSGRAFMEDALADPQTSSVVMFGFDDNALPYEGEFRRTGKKFVFEGPGQDPFIVFRDADAEAALQDLVTAKFMYSGQTCTAPKRVFIEAPIYDEFLERLVERSARLQVGDPADRSTDVSPVGSDLAVARIQEQLSDAQRQGAKILLGGEIEGNLIHPTVVRDCTDQMLGMREEVFGPVVFTSNFGSCSEVLARAKNHKYGLRAAVYGGSEGARAAKELSGESYCHVVPDFVFGKFGTVAHNEPRSESWKGAFITKPVGGYGYSGWIWETVNGQFRLKQGPKLLSTETSREN